MIRPRRRAQRGELGGLRALDRERLLDEHVLAGRERGHAERVCVETGVAINTASTSSASRVCEVVSAYGRVAAADGREPLPVEIADGDELGLVELVEVPNEVRAPVAEADDGDADGTRSRRRPPLPEKRERRPEEQSQVEPERPAVDVRDVHVECLAERRVRTARDLPEPGDALRNEESID